MQSPCYDCKERREGCHGTCERYKEFDEKCSKARQERFSAKAADRDYIAAKIEAYKIGARRKREK